MTGYFTEDWRGSNGSGGPMNSMCGRAKENAFSLKSSADLFLILPAIFIKVRRS